MLRNFFKKCNQPAKDDRDFTNPDTALDYLLTNDFLHNGLGTEIQKEGNHLHCPKWNITLTPEIGQLTNQNAVVHFHISAPQWGKDLYECSAAVGDSTKQALDMSCVSFLSSFIDGIMKMENGEAMESLETSFAGTTHRWRVSLSNVVGIGSSFGGADAEFYWNLLKDGIIKRLGNQKLCYVKVYAAKSPENITGECRIDDIKSEELSALVAKAAENWNVHPFASQKVFFFIRQEEETILPYAYLGREGNELLRSKAQTAVSLFHACKTPEQYNQLPQQLIEALGDATLAKECYSFFPEMCTENAFPQISYSEAVQIVQESGESVICYKNQLADYWQLYAALLSFLEDGVFGDATNEIYQKYISVSASYDVIQQIYEKGGDKALEHGSLASLSYRVDSNFTIR